MEEHKPCEAVVSFVKDYGDGKPQHFKQGCVLLAPHIGYKHVNPNLLMTMGGERVTHDIYGKSIVNTWSPFVERIGE